MTIDITAILTAALAVIGAVITGVAVPYIKSITTAAQRETLQALVTVAVTAAEQIFEGDGAGAMKKRYVTEWVFARGISLEDEDLDALIEAAVFELKGWGGALA